MEALWFLLWGHYQPLEEDISGLIFNNQKTLKIGFKVWFQRMKKTPVWAFFKSWRSASHEGLLMQQPSSLAIRYRPRV